MANLPYDQVDDLRRRGDITWEQYKQMMKGAFKWNPDIAVKDKATGKRDWSGRLTELEHVKEKS